jgi:uncharacterized protein (DUF697 family)
MSPRARSIPVKEVVALARELRRGGEDRPLVVAGVEGLAAALRRELVRGGVESAVRAGGAAAGAAAVVYVLAGKADEEDLAYLREADHARVPVVAVITAPPGGDGGANPPYVLPERVVRVPPGAGFPVEQIARALAKALGDRATPLAARLPVLREAVVDDLIRRYSRQNAIIGVAIWIPGADMPVLTLNQIRLLLRIADAHGFELDRERVPEVLGVIAGGLGFRAAARSTLGLVPVAGWAVKGGFAYVGTRAVGEAARRYFEARAPLTRTLAARLRFPR